LAGWILILTLVGFCFARLFQYSIKILTEGNYITVTSIFYRRRIAKSEIIRFLAAREDVDSDDTFPSSTLACHVKGKGWGQVNLARIPNISTNSEDFDALLVHLDSLVPKAALRSVEFEDRLRSLGRTKTEATDSLQTN
jgi:hypothetical protein